ncbi:MAG: 4-hydroxy-3-methylbut-2-enyl diphosphate reductase [Lachnospiraceae bacterium]|nr:4-hydroxy-3-methylbut-2-enyl diphosphate reductase [Lachnospiraceae bacterium]
MNIVTAKTAGFCFGVQRAMDSVYELIEKGGDLYTYGPLIHNDAVVDDLSKKGVRVIESDEELNEIKSGTVVIRAHGVPEKTIRLIEERGLTVVDNTCPFVKRIHKLVSEKSAEGYQIVVTGNAGHPEVIGIVGWAMPDRKTGRFLEPSVIETAEEAAALKLDPSIPVFVVSQTTFRKNKFQELVEILEKRKYNVNVVDTVCNATKERQTEARDIASKVDAMIVIGGRQSSNTQKLYEICKGECEHAYFIESAQDLRMDIPKTASTVGITAGASTPKKFIEEVQNYVRINF